MNKTVLALCTIVTTGFMLTSCSNETFQDSGSADAATISVAAPKTVKVERLRSLADQGTANAMAEARTLLPDLSKTRDVAADGVLHLSEGTSPEAWYYSAAADITVIEITNSGAIAHVFHGKTMTTDEFDALRNE